MLAKRLIKSNDAGGCTNTVDLYNPFPDGGGVALYQLNGDATDVSGNYDGTATNVTYGAGQFGQAGIFNGSNSKITTVASQLPVPASGAFTVSFWAKVDSSMTQYNTCMMSFGDFWLKSEYPNGEFGLGDINTTERTTTSMGYGWNHCVLTVDASNNISLYLNGAEEFNGNKSISRTNGGNFAIGVARLNSPVYYFNGELDQVRIFSRALRPYEVEALYTEEYCTPTIVPSEHFNTVFWTGDSNNPRDITDVGFQPDLVWIKSRDGGGSPFFDSVRGASYYMNTYSTAAEVFDAGLSSFNPNGFTLNSTSYNYTGERMVAWNFKAGGAEVENTDGTITSQVSANTDAGFSIVTFTSPNGASDTSYTVGHGLGITPNVVIAKSRNATGGWYTYHSGATNNNQFIRLDTTGAVATAGSAVWGAGMTNNVIGVTLDQSIDQNDTNVAYCFAEVEGFSNFGSYVGNGSTSGPTVVTGFEPAFVMIKWTGGPGGNWQMMDNKRGEDKQLFANLSNAEGANNYDGLDFLENGFQLKTDYVEFNGSGQSYIYMAFAADPTTIEPSLEDSFNTVTYTGNGGTQSITGVGFQPDWTWIKNRTNPYSHQLYDSVRGLGSTKNLQSDNTLVEGSYASRFGFISSFDSDGYTVQSGTSTSGNQNILTNQSGQNYVAWNWKGAEIPAINSNGSITSVVSANPAAGFSIVSYKGNGTAGATVGHGLTNAPSMYIVKDRSSVSNWRIYHGSLGATKALEFNTNAESTNIILWNNTEPTSSVFSLGTFSDVNANTKNFIAYCFAGVAGFSKFGSYTGTGNTSGTTVSTGFEVAFLLVKKATGAADDWFMFDNKRTPVGEAYLRPNSASQELDYGGDFMRIDATDGFQPIWNSPAINASGETYIYMAFANQF